MVREVEFETIGFSSEFRRKEFIVWLDGLLKDGLVEEVEAKSVLFHETRFFRIVGQSQIWTLTDPIEPARNWWGYFSPLKHVPVHLEEKVFYRVEEFQEFSDWLRVQIDSETMCAYGRSVLSDELTWPGDESEFEVFRTWLGSDYWILTAPTEKNVGSFKKVVRTQSKRKLNRLIGELKRRLGFTS